MHHIIPCLLCYTAEIADMTFIISTSTNPNASSARLDRLKGCCRQRHNVFHIFSGSFYNLPHFPSLRGGRWGTFIQVDLVPGT